MPVLASQSRYNRFRGLGCMFYRLRFVGAVYRDLFCLYDIIVLVNPNFLFALGLSSYSGRDKNRLDEIVEKSLRGAALWDEVKDRLNKSAMGLSGGQQQRLCIARAIAMEPEVILMDEPTSALDPIATKKVEELMEQLKEKYTIVIVTHSMQQAARISDKTAFFLMGELIEFDDTNKVFTNPQDKRTEDYITGRFG